MSKLVMISVTIRQFIVYVVHFKTHVMMILFFVVVREWSHSRSPKIVLVHCRR